MKARHVNLEVKKCGSFINKENPFLHATPDFLVSCDCCGSGCGEVKCPVVIIDGIFDDYVQHKNSCLEKVNGNLQLKERHSYYYQVQQQLFSVPDLQYDDFVWCMPSIRQKTLTCLCSVYIQMCSTGTLFCLN